MIENETSNIVREDKLSERNILVKLVGWSYVISLVRYPWISLGEARRLSLDVISPDVFYARNS